MQNCKNNLLTSTPLPAPSTPPAPANIGVTVRVVPNAGPYPFSEALQTRPRKNTA